MFFFIMMAGCCNLIFRSVIKLVESKPFNNFILSIIFVNTTIITAQTDKRSEMAAGNHLHLTLLTPTYHCFAHNRIFHFLPKHPSWCLIVCFFYSFFCSFSILNETHVDAAGWYFSVCDCIFLGIYISEMLTKLYVYRTNYFKSGWNTFGKSIVNNPCFSQEIQNPFSCLLFLDLSSYLPSIDLWTDFVIVLTSFVDWLRFAIAMTSAINPKIFRLLRVFRAIRALRALRTLRAVSFLQSLQVIVSTLLKSIPALGSIVLLLFLILCIQTMRFVFPPRGIGLSRMAFTLISLVFFPFFSDSAFWLCSVKLNETNLLRWKSCWIASFVTPSV